MWHMIEGAFQISKKRLLGLFNCINIMINLDPYFTLYTRINCKQVKYLHLK